MAKKYCNRCSHDIWYSDEKKRWYCTNPKCVKYKKPPTDDETAQTTEEVTDEKE